MTLFQPDFLMPVKGESSAECGRVLVVVGRGRALWQWAVAPREAHAGPAARWIGGDPMPPASGEPAPGRRGGGPPPIHPARLATVGVFFARSVGAEPSPSLGGPAAPADVLGDGEGGADRLGRFGVDGSVIERTDLGLIIVRSAPSARPHRLGGASRTVQPTGAPDDAQRWLSNRDDSLRPGLKPPKAACTGNRRPVGNYASFVKRTIVVRTVRSVRVGQASGAVRE